MLTTMRGRQRAVVGLHADWPGLGFFLTRIICERYKYVSRGQHWGHRDFNILSHPVEEPVDDCLCDCAWLVMSGDFQDQAVTLVGFCCGGVRVQVVGLREPM